MRTVLVLALLLAIPAVGVLLALTVGTIWESLRALLPSHRRRRS